MLFYQVINRWFNTRKQEKEAQKIIDKLIKSGCDYSQDIPYTSNYEENVDYSQEKTDIKTIAFYLPQFHTFPENDSWWGKGFTEWVNTEKSLPRFDKHYQPRRPHEDIGYYDLSIANSMEKQVRLALQHKLYGFCFYYYWFSGKKLMEKPIDIFMNHPEWKINFCLCWANENFTRAWDGANNEILMEQKYEQSDPENFIADIKKYMEDPRYIKVNGKPVIIIYNMGNIPSIEKTIHAWRAAAQKHGVGEILIWMCRTNNNTAKILKIQKEIDAEVEFPPHSMWWPAIKMEQQMGMGEKIYSYHKLIDILTYKIRNKKGCMKYEKPVYHSCMMGWDNSCRRKKGWTVYYGYTTTLFAKWLTELVRDIRTHNKLEERFLFVNAWNEWGEGTYLEPDEKYGYANINTLSEIICKK